ncbi:secreted protein [Melampsora americana]|nr:secreted protein [Melampsora americana]
MFKLHSYSILALIAMFCTVQFVTSQLSCGSPSGTIGDDSCKQALQMLSKYTQDGMIVRDEKGFQVSCKDCKLTIMAKTGTLNVDAQAVQTGLNDILTGCPSTGSSCEVSGATLTISYPTSVLSGCSMI